MAGNKYSPVRGGQPGAISATVWNEMLMMLAEWKANGNRGSTGRSDKPWIGTTCTVRNNSGSDIPRWGILAIDSPTFDPGATKPEDTPTQASRGFENSGLFFEGSAPVAGGKFVITLGPIKDGKCGPAVCAGLVQCRLDVDDEEATYTGAEMIADDSEKLSAGGSGWASIIWKQEGEGTVWGVISIGGASGCAPQNEFQIITVFGRPAGGTFSLLVSLPDDEGEMVAESITINRGDTIVQILAALETHSVVVAIREAEEEAEEDPQELFQVTGGPLPNNAVQVEFKGAFAGTDIPAMLPQNFDDLTGGTGVGVLVSVDHQGH